MRERVGRNDPCPCGSGRKFKNCCEGKVRFQDRTVAGVHIWVLAALGAAAVAIVVGVSMMGRTPARQTGTFPPTGGPNAQATAGPPGEPWEYDSTSNRHFDPTHGHWHQGPPPPPDQRNQPTPPGAATLPPPGGVTPKAFEYDSVNNRHWDPAHGHWHQGPPPPGTP